MNKLKELLGEELYNQVIEKIGDTPISVGEERYLWIGLMK